MAAITSITENWSGHSFKEVETHIKGSYLPLTSVSVDSISSGVANVLTLNSSNAVKKTSLSDLASLLGVWSYEKTLSSTGSFDVTIPSGTGDMCIMLIREMGTTGVVMLYTLNMTSLKLVSENYPSNWTYNPITVQVLSRRNFRISWANTEGGYFVIQLFNVKY